MLPRCHTTLPLLALLAAFFAAGLLVAGRATHADTAEQAPAVVCGNLVYAGDKTSRCFADAFLQDTAQKTNIRVAGKFESVRADSSDLYMHPLVVMTGEGDFELTEKERRQLKRYLTRGGFMIASSGCSNGKWDTAFRREIAKVLPDMKLSVLPEDHPAYRLVYTINPEKSDKGDTALPRLEHMAIDGRTVLVYARDGLNNSTNASQDCCCCGGSDIRQAKELNVNLLTYALTH